MLEVLLVWALVGVAALFYGEWIGNRLGTVFFSVSSLSVWMNAWLGLVFLSFAAMLLTFVTPLTVGVKLLVWLGLVAPIFYNYQWMGHLWNRIRAFIRPWNLPAWCIAVGTFCIALLKSAGVPEIFDEGAYHLPLIRMWEQQGLVIGMANLNGHYGLNSIWHVLNALANLTFVPGWQTAMALNGLTVLLLGLFAASRISVLGRRGFISDWIAAILPVLIFRNLISSPATDIPAIVATWFVFTLWLETLESRKSIGSAWPVLVILPFWIVMLKSSSAALLLIPTVFLVRCWLRKEWRILGAVCFIGLLLFLPWILENWLLTGYAIFPVRLTALGEPEWQVPLASIDKKFYMAQFGVFAPPAEYSISWLKSWFSAQNSDTRVLLLFAVSGLMSSLVFLIRTRTQLRAEGTFLTLAVVGCLTTWMLTITEPRYGFGALVFTALFPIGMVANWFGPKVSFTPVFVWIFVAFQGFNLYKTTREFSFEKVGIWSPAPRPRVEFTWLKCGNFTAATPVRYQSEVPAGKPPFCWDCPFPCVPKEGKPDSLHLFKKEKFGRTAFIFKP